MALSEVCLKAFRLLSLRWTSLLACRLRSCQSYSSQARKPAGFEFDPEAFEGSVKEEGKDVEERLSEGAKEMVAKSEVAQTKSDEGLASARLKPPTSHESPSLLYDPLANKFINMLMRDGKKTQAKKIFTQTLGLIKRTQLAKVAAGEKDVIVDPIKIFHQAVENCKPSVATEIKKRGGKSYHIPCSLREQKRSWLSLKWLLMSARERRGIGMSKKMAIDIIDSYNHQGLAIKKKQDLHRLADANRAYAHFRW